MTEFAKRDLTTNIFIALVLKVIYQPFYGMNNYVLIWCDWLSCDPLRGSYRETIVPHLVATMINLSQIYSYYTKGDRSPLTMILFSSFPTHCDG